MTAKYFAILTNQGAARLANAAALGTKLNLTQMAVGDANGTLPTPDPTQTKLISQKRIAPLNLLTVDPTNTSQIIAEQIIPENEGGFWIREIGLYDDDGILIAVANCPETYKPQLQEGSGRTQTIRMILIVSSTSAITLKIDPSVVLATRQYVDDKIIEVKSYADGLMRTHEQSRNHPDATTTAKGFTQLNSSVTDDRETQSATPKAVKIAMDNANARLAKERNLADLPNPALARQNLQLGDSSTKNTGTTANTLAAGDDARITGAMQKSQNGADIPDVEKFLQNLGLQTIKPDPRSTKIYSPDLKKFLMVSDTIWGMWNGESNAPVALTIEQGGTGETTVDGVKAAFGIDKLQPKGNYADKSAKTPQIFSDAIKAKYGLEIKDASEIGSVSLYAANNEASIHGWSGQKITIPDKAGTMALAGESVSGLRLSSPREVTVTSADAWINFSISEIVVGIYITPTAGGGAWVLNKVKVATLQALINGAWVNVTQ
ncbi:phage tail protein [Citrobacter sp. RHBSTW-00229]|uniref:phage tail protein n=1 Tax=Citrobacter sp. RHBSTW-00229 TaxID=2742641 RepID=UPI002016CD13|nr:phage tail protein [Citrobacter sp. RHBSTW-00229]